MANLATDAAGNVYAAGPLGPYTNVGVFVNRYDCAGNLSWSQAFPHLDQETIQIAVDAAGDTYVVNEVPAQFDCPGQTAPSIVAKLDPGGSCVWSKSWGPGSGASQVAVTPSGNVVLLGAASPGMDFGCGAVSGGYLLEIDPAGNILWSKSFGGIVYQDGLAVDSAGNLFLCGPRGGSDLDFGGGPLAPGALFFAKLDAGGQHVWSTVLGSPSATTVGGCVAAADPKGNLLVGVFSGIPSAFPGVPFAAAVVAKLDGNDGTLLFTRSDTLANLGGIAADPAGNVVAGGTMSAGQPVTFGGPPLTVPTGDTQDGFIITFSPTGAILSSQLYPHDTAVRAFTMTPSGAPVLGGTYTGAVDFGTGPLPTGGWLYVARLGP